MRKVAVTAALVALLAAPAQAKKPVPLTPEQIWWNAQQEGVPTQTETSTVTAVRCVTKGCQ